MTNAISKEDMTLYAGTANAVTITHAASAARTITLPDISDTLAGVTSPTFATPALGVATATSLNGLTVTTSTGTLTVTNGKTATLGNTLTFTGTDGSSVAFGAGGTAAFRGDNLGVFAATTSAQLLGVISDETGSGALVFATSPTLVTPALGAATATSINGLTVTTSTGTLTIANGKTHVVSNGLTFTGTDSTSFAFPATSDTVAALGIAQTFSKGQTITPAVLTALTLNPTTAPTGSASTFRAGEYLASGTVAFATSPQTGSFFGVDVDQSTLTNPSSGTIATAASHHVVGPPVASTNVTITSPYVYWGQGGVSRFDTQVAINGAIAGSARLVVNHASGATGSASAYRGAVQLQASTITYTTTPQTGNYTAMEFGAVTIVNPSSGTIADAYTFKLDAPVASTNTTFTRSGAIWVASGTARFDDNVLLGSSSADLIGVYGATAIAQRSGAAQTAIATTSATNVTPFGYTTAAQADAIVTLANELRAWAVAQGWIKGSA